MPELKTGYTTGSCAAAAAKAAAILFFTGEKRDEVTIILPAGTEAVFKVEDAFLCSDYASCSIRKFAGDDPDITDGIKVFAHVSVSRELEITGGDGIGMVTRPGLSITPGHYAINPVPLSMIRNEVLPLLPPGQGARIEISVPGGAELAHRTFNPSLGIVGGISIIGTTGIVKPMSEEAVKKSLALKLSQARAMGTDPVVFCPGNYGVNFLKSILAIPDTFICQTGNYIGYMLDEAVALSVPDLLVAGHIGKLVKLAGRIFNTHSRVADARKEILAAHYALYSGDMAGVRKIMTAATTEEAALYIPDQGFYDTLADTIAAACRSYTRDKITVACMLFSVQGGLIGKSAGSTEMIAKIKEGLCRI